MEVVLGEYKRDVLSLSVEGLNPCFSGSCSWSLLKVYQLLGALSVLILVLVEVVLGEITKSPVTCTEISLNPCFSGSCSWSCKTR